VLKVGLDSFAADSCGVGYTSNFDAWLSPIVRRAQSITTASILPASRTNFVFCGPSCLGF